MTEKELINELVEALKPLAFFSGDIGYGKDQDRLTAMFSKARTALAKAAGHIEAFTPSGADCHPESPHASEFRLKVQP